MPVCGSGSGVGVAADVGPAFEHQDALAELGGRPFGDRQTEETGADDEQVIGLGSL